MLLTYVDESFTDDWYTMAALLLDGAAAAALSADLDSVAAAAASAYGLSAEPEIELHGHEIFHAAKAWKGVPPRARIGVFDDVVEAIAAQQIQIIARAMDEVGQRERYPAPPHSVVLKHHIQWCSSTCWSASTSARWPMMTMPW